MTSPESQNVFAAQRPRPSLRRLPQFIFAALIVVVLAQLGVSLARGRYERAAAEARQRQQQLLLVLDELRQTTDELTRMARTFVITGDTAYENAFNAILAIRDGRQPRPPHYDKVYWDLVLAFGAPASAGAAESFESIVAGAGFAVDELTRLERLKRDTDQLALLERIAMNAAKGVFRDSDGQFTRRGAPDQAYATRLLHGAEYHQDRGRVMLVIHQAQMAVERRTRTELLQAERGLRQVARVEAGLIAGTVLLLAGAFLLIHRRIMEPIEQLTASAAAVGRNGFFRRVIMERDDELGTLAGALNRMSETVEDKARETEATEERFRKLLEAAPDALVVADGEGRISAVNPRAEALLGMTRADAEGKPLASVLPELAASGLARRTNASCELVLRPGQEKELTLEVVQNISHRADGSEIVCIALRDVSAARGAEAERTREQHRHAALFDALPQPLLVVGAADRISLVNQAFERVSGLNRTAVVGKSVSELDFLAEAERRQLAADFGELARSGGQVDRELAVLARDGFERMTRWSMAGFQALDGALGGVVATLVDITDRRRTEAELAANRLESGRLREEAAGLQAALAQLQTEVTTLRGDTASGLAEAGLLREELENVRVQLTEARDAAGAAEALTAGLRSELEEANMRLVELAITQAQMPVDTEVPGPAVVPPDAESDELNDVVEELELAVEDAEADINAADNAAVDDELGSEPDWEVNLSATPGPEEPATTGVEITGMGMAVSANDLTEREPVEAPDEANSQAAESAEDLSTFEPAAEPAVEEPAGETRVSTPFEEGASDEAATMRDDAMSPVGEGNSDAVEPVDPGQPEAGGGEAASESKPGKRKRTPRKKKERTEVQVDLFGGYDGAKDEAGPVRVTLDSDGMPVVAGLDLRDAAVRLGIPPSTLVQKVVEFAEGLPSVFEELRAALAVADHDLARRHAHSVAGTAGSVSADTLRRLAKTLELALKFEQGDAARMLADLEREAARVMEAARQLAAMFGSAPEVTATPIGVRRLATILEELSAALEDGEMEGIGQAVAKLKSESLPARMQAGYERLSELIDNFEYADAAVMVRAMIEQIR